MSVPIKPAVERTMQQINAMLGDEEPKFLPSHARSVLNAALSVDEIAQKMRSVQTGRGGWDYLAERTRKDWREKAQALVDSILGADS